jgi:GNAT superfamily N-acetyltransferase
MGREMVDVRQVDLTKDEMALRAQFIAANQSLYQGYDWPLESEADSMWFTNHRIGFGKIRNIFGAYERGQMIGFVETNIQKLPGFFKQNNVCRIAYLHVVPEQRKRGIASKLLDAAEHWAREQGAQISQAEVMTKNTLGEAAFVRSEYFPYYTNFRKVL